MPTPYPKEFREDVIKVARQGDQSIAKVARSSGVSESCLSRWLRIADRDDARAAGGAPGAPSSGGGDESAELRELRRRTKQLEQENEILRRATAYFARDVLQNDVPAGSRARRRRHPGDPLVPGPRVLSPGVLRVVRRAGEPAGLGRRPPHQRRPRGPPRRPRVRLPVHHRPALAARGHIASRNRVNRLCTQQGFFSAHSRKRGTGRRPGPPVRDDLVTREFTASRVDELWLTDITEHPTAEGKLYLCAIKDACSTRIVGYSIDIRMTAELAVNALRNAIALRRPAPGTVVHSDRGSQGGLNRSSQHLVIVEVCGGASSTGSGPGGAAGDEVTGPAVSRAGGGAGVLATDRTGQEQRGRVARCRRVHAGRCALVSRGWRDAAAEPGRAVRPLPVPRRA
ncbi:transposase [Motilibacter rhizosphaerae]|uniref:Transposase n=1 Tax=Motilibacter rhizosphaerae TaxID=598652 RepID=A0A4Q7N7C2_9ACTN|nr:transposase [Motilibacter rhizosphaerae]